MFTAVGVCFAALFASCRSTSNGTANSDDLSASRKQGVPFSTKEPEVFQADFVITAGGIEKRWFVAKKGDRCRTDSYSDGRLLRTELIKDKIYDIDHLRRIYAERKVVPVGSKESPFSSLNDDFFKSKEYREFEEVGRENGTVKYRVRTPEKPGSDVLLTIDETTGLIIREEFSSTLGAGANRDPAVVIYELRNLKTEVDDSVFSLPADYKQVPPEEIRKTAATPAK
jgi:hypothetical protein